MRSKGWLYLGGRKLWDGGVSQYHCEIIVNQVHLRRALLAQQQDIFSYLPWCFVIFQLQSTVSYH